MMSPGHEEGRPRQESGPVSSTTQHGTRPGDIALGDEVTTATVPRSDAQRRCQQIQLLLESMTRQKEKILVLVTEAKEHDDHLALGYPSWPAYVSAEFAAALTEVTRDDRRWFAFALSETGMSSRAIAPIVGVTDRQVRRDVDQVAQVGQDVPPDGDVLGEDLEDRLDEDLEDRLGEDRDLDARLGNALAEIFKITSTTPTNVVVGMDGKSYPTYLRSRKPSRRKRRPQPVPRDQAFYDRDTAQQHCQEFARALAVAYGMRFPEARQRSIGTYWPTGASGASPAMRANYTPERIRQAAAALTTYAEEMEHAQLDAIGGAR